MFTTFPYGLHVPSVSNPPGFECTNLTQSGFEVLSRDYIRLCHRSLAACLTDRIGGMKERAIDKAVASKKYVLGSKGFAAISAVEGLKLNSGSEERLKRTSSLSHAQRRAETIRAFASTRKRG
jgi:hypothetical protein